MKKKTQLQAHKVAASNTLKTRVVKSAKSYTRKIKHRKAGSNSEDGSAFLFTALF